MEYNIETSEISAAKRQELLRLLFNTVDGTKISEAYRSALRNNDENDMIRTLAEYYRNRPESPYLQQKIKASAFSVETAERAVRNDVTVVNIPWQFRNGINWIFNPTWENKPVNPEWLWQLGRMYFRHDMVRCYQENGGRRFAQAFADQVTSWIYIFHIAHPLPQE